MITDKQLIETLKNIKNNCNKNLCGDCIFYNGSDEDEKHCQLTSIAFKLAHTPSTWDIEKIEEIINE